MEIFSHEYALLSIQSALIGAVTPELRVVVVDVNKEEQWLYLRFYYDGDVSEKLIDLWQCAITESSADFGPDCVLDEGVERFDYPRRIPIRGKVAFFRMEPSFSSTCITSLNHDEINKIENFNKEVGVFIEPVKEEKLKTTYGIYYKNHLVPAKPLSHKITIVPIAYALLAIQRALLKKITPELRAIIVDVEAQLLYIYLYHVGSVDEKMMSLWHSVIIETYAALGIDYALEWKIERCDYPHKIPFRGRYAYLKSDVH